MSKMDDSMSQVVEVLHQKQMLSNSIIVFISDNGAPSVDVFQNWGFELFCKGCKCPMVV